MSKKIAVAVLTLAAVGGIAAGQGTPPPPPELERARAAAAALTSELKARLMKEMAAGGAVAAVRVCSEVSQQIAKDHSTGGVIVRRVSDRWRNPADEPDAWELEQLRKLAASHAGGTMPEELYEVVGKDGWRVLRYVKPITLARPCLSCHGDPASMKPEVVALLRERYPDDSATGYHDGDLRGVVSVSVVMH